MNQPKLLSNQLIHKNKIDKFNYKKTNIQFMLFKKVFKTLKKLLIKKYCINKIIITSKKFIN